jgi:catechol 2,3-dioxygenase-like lactoylglutathione lyase family enzyme
MGVPMTVRHLALAVQDEERSRRFYEHYFGFGARTPRRYPDGVLMLYDETGFALALGPADGPPASPVSCTSAGRRPLRRRCGR